MKQTLWTVGLASLLLASVGYSQDKIEDNEDGGVETITVTGERPGVGAGANPGVVIGGPGTISGAGGSGGHSGSGVNGPAKTTKADQDKANAQAKAKIGTKTIIEKENIAGFIEWAKGVLGAFGKRVLGGYFKAEGKPDGSWRIEACGSFQAGTSSGKENFCAAQHVEEVDMPDGTKMIRFTYKPIQAECASYDARFDAIFWKCTPSGSFEVYGRSLEEIAMFLEL